MIRNKVFVILGKFYYIIFFFIQNWVFEVKEGVVVDEGGGEGLRKGNRKMRI